MATYKVIQDIEAEDHILGPLTLRQFIFALISLFLFYISFIILSKGLYLLLVLFVPPALFFGFFAMPFGRDQPTEIWALAKLRYWFKPRRRLWNQSGVKELVTINVPKRIERVLTNGLSQTEVNSRLKALANTLDSRGWAVKNVAVNTYAAPAMMEPSTDRLIGFDSIPQPVPDGDLVAADDILDQNSNPIARQFDSMINQSSRDHRQKLVSQLNTAAPVPPASQPLAPPPNDYWFMDNAQSTTPIAPVQAAPVDAAEEAAIVSQLKATASSHPAPYGNLRTMQPLSPAPQPAAANPAASVTPSPDPAILSLSENDDLNVATLAREARRAKGEDDRPQDNEVVIPLR